MAMWNRVAKFRQAYRRGGWKEVLMAASHSPLVKKYLFSYSCFGLYRLNGDLPTLRGEPRWQIGEGKPDDIPRLAAMTTDSPEARQTLEAIFRAFLSDGGKCFVARLENHIIGYEWRFSQRFKVTCDHYGKRTFTIRLGSRQRFLSNGFIAPAYRLRGVFPDLTRAAIGDSEATVTVCTHIEHTNHSSVKAHERLGFSLIGNLHCWQVPWICHLWLLCPAGRLPILLINRTVELSELLAERSAVGDSARTPT